MNTLNFKRRIHMDFHTPEMLESFAIDAFNPLEYVATLKEAKVDSLVVFAKCHHGNMYYETKIGHKHGGLPVDIDMFKAIKDECDKQGLKVVAYYSVGWLTPIQKEKPQWIERNSDGQMVGTSNIPKTGPWACICLNSPYLEEVIFPEIEELMTLYSFDGIWFDIIENNPCFCENCRKKYQELYHKPYPTPDKNDMEIPKEIVAFAKKTKIDFVTKLMEKVNSLNPEVLTTYNTAGRDIELISEVDFCSVETHPGASWDSYGWIKGLLTYKYLQSIKKPWESTTSRFIHGWGGWDDQPVANMKTVCSRIVAHGGMINLGDQAYPNGTLDKELYKRIGEVFNTIIPFEKHVHQSESLADVALLLSQIDIYGQENEQYFGASQILSENQWCFDVLIDGYNLSRIKDYRCIILPEVGKLSDETCNRIEEYVANGGNVICVGNSSYDQEHKKYGLEKIMHITEAKGLEETSNYMVVKEEINAGIRRSPLLIPGKVIQCSIEDVNILATLCPPIIHSDEQAFEIFRNPEFAPPGQETNQPLIWENTYGHGKCVTIAYGLFSGYIKENQWYFSDVYQQIMKRILPIQTVKVTGSKDIEVNMTMNNQNKVIHLIGYHLHKEQSLVRELYPIHQVTVDINKGLLQQQSLSKSITKDSIKILPEDVTYQINENSEQLSVVIDQMEGYVQVIIE